MKKLSVILLLLSLGLLLIACTLGDDPQKAPETTDSATEQTTATETADTSGTEPGSESETETETETETRLWNPIIVDEFVALGDVGFELVNHDPSVIDRYALAIGALAADLDGLATVYELTAPASCCFGITGEENILLGASDPVAAMEYTHAAMMSVNARLVAEGKLQNPIVIMDLCDLLGRSTPPVNTFTSAPITIGRAWGPTTPAVISWTWWARITCLCRTTARWL